MSHKNRLLTIVEVDNRIKEIWEMGEMVRIFKDDYLLNKGYGPTGETVAFDLTGPDTSDLAKCTEIIAAQLCCDIHDIQGFRTCQDTGAKVEVWTWYYKPHVMRRGPWAALKRWWVSLWL